MIALAELRGCGYQEVDALDIALYTHGICRLYEEKPGGDLESLKLRSA